MRIQRLYPVLVTVLALAASGAGTASAAATPLPVPIGCKGIALATDQVALAEWREDLSTGAQGGTPDAFGAVDSKWTTVSPVAGPAYSIAPNAAWVTSPSANWIHSNRPGGGGPVGPIELNETLRTIGDATGTADIVDLQTTGLPLPAVTKYRMTFDLPKLTVGRALVFDYAADNGVLFYLNGQPVGGFDPGVANPDAFHLWHHLVYTGPAFHAGTNVLDAVVTDYGVATGVIVNGAAHACIGEARAGVCLAVKGETFQTYPPRSVPISTAPGVPFGTPVGPGGWDTVPTTGQAFSVDPHPSWITTPNARWINDTATRVSGGYGVQTRTFQIQFDLGSGTAYRDLDFRFAVDNGVAFLLNGTPIGGYNNGEVSTAFQQFRSVNWAGAGFVSGVNTLRAVVTDHGTARGLLVEGVARTCNASIAIDIDDPLDAVVPIDPLRS